MRSLSLFLLVACALIQPTFAAPEAGCEGFAWPLEQKRKLLLSAQKVDIQYGLSRDALVATQLKLAPIREVEFVKPPEREPKSDASYGGIIQYVASQRPGEYLVTLSAAAWVDVVQDDAYAKLTAFTSSANCPGIRKSVRFTLGANPFVLQISGAETDFISAVVTPAPQ